MTPLLQLGLIALGLYVAGWMSEKLGLSSIVGYIVLGLVLGPYGIYHLYQAGDLTETLGELGIILLLFYLGLEFSLKRFLEGGKATLLAGGLDLGNFAVGVLLGWLLGLGWLASLFLGAIVYVSSSGVVAKLLGERNLVAYPEAERTLGVLVFEDLAMVIVLAGLGFLTAGGQLGDLAGVLIFLAIYALLQRFAKPFIDRLLNREGEALVLLALGVVVLFAMGAKSLDFPDAVAAFLLGMILGESHFSDRVEQVLHPWRDVAAAIFFFSFGLDVDISSALRRWPAALLLVCATLIVNLLTGYAAGRLTGLGKRASVGHGLMLLPRGEFSLLLVSVAGGASALSAATKATLLGTTSLYVIAMIIVSSLVFRYYDEINARLTSWVQTPAQRQAEAARRRELEAVGLEQNE